MSGHRPPYFLPARARARRARAATRARDSRCRAFTLAELSVVIGIVVVLIALLIPALGTLRQNARDVVCVGRLRDLSMACTSYFADHGRYPDPPRSATTPLLPLPASASASAQPQNIDTRLLNALEPYVKYPVVALNAAASDLPPAAQCPSVEDVADGRGPWPGADPASSVYYTGYVYAARLTETPNVILSGGALLPGLPLPDLLNVRVTLPLRMTAPSPGGRRASPLCRCRRACSPPSL